jgi:hypothetical protein
MADNRIRAVDCYSRFRANGTLSGGRAIYARARDLDHIPSYGNRRDPLGSGGVPFGHGWTRLRSEVGSYHLLDDSRPNGFSGRPHVEALKSACLL